MTRIVDWIGRLAWPTGPGAFRLWLAYLVFVNHLSSFAIGKMAVYVFFGLSGFWLQTMWTARYSKAHAPYLIYLVSRLWRLAPVMIVVSIAILVIYPVLGYSAAEVAPDPLHLAFSTIFLLGYGALEFLPLGPAWSLDVEWQFYLVVPLLAWMAARWPIILLVVAAAASLWASQQFEIEILPRYLFFFVAGMVAAIVGWHPGKRIAIASAALVATILIGVTLSDWRGIVWGGATPGPLFVYHVPFNVGLAVILLPLAFYTVRQDSDSTDRAMGDLSYPVYLMHWIAAVWFATIAAPFEIRALVAGAGIVLVTLGSIALWYWVDRPLNRARARWVAARIPRTVSSDRTAAEPAAP